MQLLTTPFDSIITLDELRLASGNDDLFCQVCRFTINGWLRTIEDSLLWPFSQIRDELSFWNNSCLARGERAVVPASLQQKILSMAHEGHSGMVKTKQKCRTSVWWPGIDKQSEDHVRSCEACIQSGKSIKPTKLPLNRVKLPKQPWQKLQIDIVDEIHGAPSTHKYIIVVHDLHSKWAEIHLCSHVSSQRVISFLCDLFTRWGLLEVIISDNGHTNLHLFWPTKESSIPQQHSIIRNLMEELSDSTKR